MKVVFAEGLEPIIDEMDLWWRTHREKAPNLFAEELSAACSWIAEEPEIFPVHRVTRLGKVRRVLMPKTCNHVYFVHQVAEQVVQVVSVWGGPRGREPELG